MFFSKKTIGLDISDDFVKVVEVSKRRGFLKLEKKALSALESGVVKNGQILEKTKLALALKEVFKKADIHLLPGRNIYFACPESQIYIRFIDIDNIGLNKNELREKAFKEASDSIPLEKEDLLLNYKIVNGEDKKKKRLLLLAVSRKVISEWQTFFSEVKMDINFFDVADLAFRRILLDGLKDKVGSVMLVAVGSAEVSLSIYKNRELYYSGFINTLLEKKETVEEETAEGSNKKKASDKKKSKIKVKIPPFLQSKPDEMVRDFNSVLSYFKNNNRDEEIKALILTGHSDSLKPVVDYLKNKMSLLVEPAQMKRVKNNEFLLDYALSIGVAVRALERKWKRKDLIINPVKKVKKLKDELKTETQDRDIKSDKESMDYKLEHGQVKKKVRKQVVKLIMIMVVGVAIFYLAFWYRNYNKQLREKDLKFRIDELKTQEQKGGG